MTKTVLIVDDDAMVRTYVKAVLTNAGFGTLEAANGTEALEQMRKCDAEVDVVLSDVVMPKMDGFALTRAIRAEFPKTPVILTSGCCNAEQMRELCVDFLAKPLSPLALLSTIDKVTTPKKEPRSELGHNTKLHMTGEAGG